MTVISNIAAPAGVNIKTRSLSERIRKRLRANSDEGQSLLEFALCLPILLLVVTGITTFGFTLNNYLVMTEAVSTSARLLAISRGNTTDPCALTATAFQNASPYLNASNLSFSFVLNTTPYSGTSCSSSSTTTGAAGNLLQGDPAQITVTYPCNLSVYGANLLPGRTLKVQTTELVQ